MFLSLKIKVGSFDVKWSYTLSFGNAHQEFKSFWVRSKMLNSCNFVCKQKYQMDNDSTQSNDHFVIEVHLFPKNHYPDFNTDLNLNFTGGKGQIKQK